MNAHALFKGREETKPAWLILAMPYLDKVERTLGETIASDVDAAFDISMHLFSAGGKRIRPTLAILCALATDPMADIERTINFATASELMHMASLVHDDVVDETSERRGTTTANAKWGNKMSVLGGDYLLAKAFALLAADNNTEVLHVLSNTAVTMTEGEILQASSEGSIEAWKENYWRIIKGKTAAFMGACCECGAIVAEAPAATRAALCEYGLQIGFAFQITDDLLDIAGDPVVIGKEIGTDLMHGKFTLPALIALENLDPEDRRLLLGSLGSSQITRDQVRGIADKVIACGALEAARQAAVDCAEKALAQLSCLADSEYKSALVNLAESVVNRSV